MFLFKSSPPVPDTINFKPTAHLIDIKTKIAKGCIYIYFFFLVGSTRVPRTFLPATESPFSIEQYFVTWRRHVTFGLVRFSSVSFAAPLRKTVPQWCAAAPGGGKSEPPEGGDARVFINLGANQSSLRCSTLFHYFYRLKRFH